MPPAAACAGAACWAAKYKKYALLRSVFCRTACQHAAAKPINQRTAARYAGAAAGMGVQAIRCGTFLYRGWNRTREIQKPLVFGGVLFHISFAVERNMAAGGIEKKVVGPLRPKVTRARERGIFPAGSVGEKKSNGPSGPPAPTGCVYLGAPVFGKPPIWTQQSRCTITDRRVSARYAGAAAGMGLQAIRCGTFLYRGWNRTREIQKPLVFGGVLFHISFAVERNMAAGGIEKKVVGPLRPKVTRARERGTLPAGDMAET